MNNFVKFVFASCLGFALAIVLTIGILVFLGVASSFGSLGSGKVKAKSVLKLSLREPIPEQSNNVDFTFGETLGEGNVPGLIAIKQSIEHAATDHKIAALWLDTDFSTIGNAGRSYLRQALDTFRASGKPIFSYTDNYSQSGYYLASAADKVFMNPKGLFDFRGYGSMRAYYKDGLDKLGVKYQVYYAGKFKSFTEKYRFNKMSEENRIQTKEYLTDLYDTFLTDISASRNIPIATLKDYANNVSVRTANDALRLGLVDSLLYSDEFSDYLHQITNTEVEDDVNIISHKSYINKTDITPKSGKNKIAVVFAEGTILDGEASNGQIGGDKYVKTLKKIRKDEKVRAVVLRVNSGGGSGFASEKILRELQIIRDKGIPVVASFGDVAASGGYYIACQANKIVAQPNTITGSIGVFAAIPNANELLDNKLGYHYDTVSLAKYATRFNIYNPFDTLESNFLQGVVDTMYEDFISRVALGRNMTNEAVNEIAQGRVWSGVDAIRIGLIDTLGVLEDAIEIAAQLADIQESYRMAYYPARKSPTETMIGKLTGESKIDLSHELEAKLQSDLGQFLPIYKDLKAMQENTGVMMKSPYEWHILD